MYRLSKILLLFFALFTFNIAASAREASAEGEDKVFEEISLPEACRPTFPGGEAAFKNAVAKKLALPSSALEEGIRGRVTVSYEIRKDGTLKNVKVVRGLNPELDRECVRAIEKVDVEWTPGRVNGIPVNVRRSIVLNINAR